MSGVTVGSHAIVGEVVVRNFPERPVVGGVPARVIHKRNRYTRPLRPLKFGIWKVSKSNTGMRSAALMQFGSKYISMGAQLVITAVLARLISPGDFGLMAIVTVFTGLFSLLSDMGVGTAIVQYRDLTEREYGGLFTFSALLAAGLSLAFCAASPFIAAVYGDTRLVPLCLASAPALLFSTLNMVPNGLMLKELRFAAIGVRLVAATVVSGGVAIAASALGAGCYALVLQTVLSAAVVFFWNIVARPIRQINAHFICTLKKIFSYSAYQFGFSLVNYFSRNLDNMLVGGILGTAALGFYDKAYKLTTYPMTAFSSVIGSVIQPFMAEHQDDVDRIYECWMRIEKLLSLVGVAVAVVFSCASAEIIAVFYGPGWEQAAPVFAVLAVSVYFQMMGNPAGAFFQSIGRTDYMFKVGLVNTAITISGLLAGLAGGSILTVAYGIFAAYCLHMVPLAYFLVKRGFGRPYYCLLNFLPEIAVGIVGIAAVAGVGAFIPMEDVFISLIVKLFVSSIALITGYALTGQLKYLTALIKR